MCSVLVCVRELNGGTTMDNVRDVCASSRSETSLAGDLGLGLGQHMIYTLTIHISEATPHWEIVGGLYSGKQGGLDPSSVFAKAPQ